MRYKTMAALAALLLHSGPAAAYTISGGTLIEDFSSHEMADFSNSTGLWDIKNQRARASAIANAPDDRPISFGDGSDGVLEVNGPYQFNTDTHPDGYNFVSVNIGAAATIDVVGTKPLIIRSLKDVVIAADIDVSGLDGANGSTTDLDGPVGGGSRTCFSRGGTGGNGAGGNGTDSEFMGNADASGGTGSVASGVAASSGDPSVSLSDAQDPAFGVFACGPGGAGGGAHAFGGAHATGGSGGGGGGMIRIIAAGDITVATIRADGGRGGNGLTDGNACSGHGQGGGGGSIWLQSLGAVSSTLLSVAGGGNLAAVDACGTGGAGGAGTIRVDRDVGGVAGADLTYPTQDSPGPQSYIVQSKPYDLGVLNAAFVTAPQITAAAPSGGTTTVSFAGSTDGIAFSDFTTDLTALSNKEYRFIKFKVQVDTAAVGLSPYVSQLRIDYEDLGLQKLSGGLGFGCASIRNVHGQDGRTGQSPLPLSLAICGLLWALAYVLMRRFAATTSR